MEDDGYTISEKGHVDVRYRGWTEVEPSIWALHDKVKSLDLSYNNLQSLPMEIRFIRRLVVLSCEINEIDHIHENIGKLRSLKCLKLSSNRLTFIPDAIGNCCSLIELHLDNNAIEILPKSIGNCFSLEVLNLQNNVLKDLPISLGKLKDSLHHIDVTNNPDLAIIPDQVQGDTDSIMWIATLRYNKTNELKLRRQAIYDMEKISRNYVERMEEAKKEILSLHSIKVELMNEREEVWFYLKLRHFYRSLNCKVKEFSQQIKTALERQRAKPIAEFTNKENLDISTKN